MDPIASLDEAMDAAQAMIEAINTAAEIAAAKDELLGKDSAVGVVRRSMGKISHEDRPAVGAKLNETSRRIGDLLESRRANLAAAEEDQKLAGESIDVTLPAVEYPAGALHLVQQTIDDVVDVFIGLGYRVAAGPEAELAWYNFDALNQPKDHPSRWETDTMYLDWGEPSDEILMRTHTSPVQVRWMETHAPPVYIVVPGRTYRKDTVDATHLPVFHQIEGLAVDQDITFSDLKGTLLHWAREFFGPQSDVRLRPHYFPFTEPSAEMDVSCFLCDGGEPGCRVCGGVGWIELLGCGMVDPNVFEAVGYDPSQVTGFAFGIGPERIAQVRHGIESMRLFIENDLRFAKQF